MTSIYRCCQVATYLRVAITMFICCALTGLGLASVSFSQRHIVVEIPARSDVGLADSNQATTSTENYQRIGSHVNELERQKDLPGAIQHLRDFVADPNTVEPVDQAR